MKKYISLLIVLCISILSFAQEKMHVTGTVKDPAGVPIAGAGVVIKGTSNGAETDVNGKFAIDVKQGSTLKFVMVGFIPAEVVVNRKIIDIILQEDKINLTEIVFTGYSKQERRDITGSVSTIKPKEVTSALSFEKLLAGKAAGVFMSSSSGALGSANLLTIRGISSIMGDNNPLYVIDGIPIYGTNRSENSTSTSGGSIPAYSFGGDQCKLKHNQQHRFEIFI